MLYPSIEANHWGLLEVGVGEQIYWEECGDESGEPIVFVHGGPGAGCSEVSRRFFNPQKYRAILFDQRGAGRSPSKSELSELTLKHMVEDMELLRKHLEIERWILFGGSWGTTLSLAYAKTHPTHVKGLLLRGVFTASASELSWLYEEGGASQIFPQQWAAFAEILKQSKESSGNNEKQLPISNKRCAEVRLDTTWKDHLSAYLKALKSEDLDNQRKVAFSWANWEHSIMSILGSPKITKADNERNHTMAIQSCHLFLNDPWLRDEKRWETFAEVEHLPCLIVQGQFDIVTPMKTASVLHQRWKNSRLLQVPGAGHASSDPELMKALINSLDHWSVM
jgi:proline iminopeptidase